MNDITIFTKEAVSEVLGFSTDRTNRSVMLRCKSLDRSTVF